LNRFILMVQVKRIEVNLLRQTYPCMKAQPRGVLLPGFYRWKYDKDGNLRPVVNLDRYAYNLA
jgi:hypothetical protein